MITVSVPRVVVSPVRDDAVAAVPASGTKVLHSAQAPRQLALPLRQAVSFTKFTSSGKSLRTG
jgi:hypothetical protein